MNAEPELAHILASLGVRRGQDLLVHCSLRRLGQVPGGPAGLAAAIRAAAGRNATIVVPTQTPLASPTSRAFQIATQGMTAQEAATFRATLPGFDPATTPSTGMGTFAEYIRTRTGSCRSSHPLTSFAACGSRAAECTAVHRVECLLGEDSPLGWLYRNEAAALLLGTGLTACTALHLAEYRASSPRPPRIYQCRIATPAGPAEMEFTAQSPDDDWFRSFMPILGKTSCLRVTAAGLTIAYLVQIGPAVDMAVQWLAGSRRW